MPKKKDEDKVCAHTKKPVKRAKRFYRDGKYYTNKNAYRAARQAEKDAAKAGAEAGSAA